MGKPFFSCGTHLHANRLCHVWHYYNTATHYNTLQHTPPFSCDSHLHVSQSCHECGTVPHCNNTDTATHCNTRSLLMWRPPVCERESYHVYERVMSHLRLRHIANMKGYFISLLVRISLSLSLSLSLCTRISLSLSICPSISPFLYTHIPERIARQIALKKGAVRV